MKNPNYYYFMGLGNENEKENDYFFGLPRNITYCYFTKLIVLILHIRSFIHSFIQVIRKIVTGSGSEDIVFQLDVFKWNFEWRFMWFSL